jgi:hypothetical protein
VRKIIPITTLGVLALIVSACGAAAGLSQSNSSNVSSGSSSRSSNSSGATSNGTPLAGPSGLQLAAGMLKLDGTSNAVTAQEASQLLPLWQSLQQMQTAGMSQATPGARPNSVMMQQTATQIALIEKAMPTAQLQAITALNLSRQDIFTVFQQAGITMGGPGQGGGFRSNGGTFTPPQGTPRAFQGSGGRPGFGSFIPPSVVNGIVQYLQKKSGA